MTLRLLLATAVRVAVLAAVAGCSSSPAASSPPPPHLAPHLAFTGAVTGTATQAVGAAPTTSAGNADAMASWTTQCAFAAGQDDPSHDAWTAQITVKTPGNEWQVTLTAPGFGNPKPGRYPLWGSTGTPPAGDLGLSVQSTKPVASYLESAGADSYSYYNPGTADYATVAASLTSGTIHVTLTPDVPSNLKFTIDGTWSCA